MNTAKEILKKHVAHSLSEGKTLTGQTLAAMQEHTDLATKALQEENRQLKERADLLFRKFKYMKSCIEQELPSQDMITFINEALTAYQTTKNT